MQQLAVLQLNLQKLSDAVYQKIAAEFNLSETAFPMPIDTDDFKTGKSIMLFTTIWTVIFSKTVWIAVVHTNI